MHGKGVNLGNIYRIGVLYISRNNATEETWRDCHFWYPTTSTTPTTLNAPLDTHTTPSSTPIAHRTTVTSPGSVPSASSVCLGATGPALPMLPAPPAFPALPSLPPPPVPHPDVPSSSAGPSTTKRHSIRTSATYLADSQGKAKKTRGFTCGASKKKVK